MRLDLELAEERRFRNGEIFLRYAVRGQSKVKGGTSPAKHELARNRRCTHRARE